jgi:hypothetical protein
VDTLCPTSNIYTGRTDKECDRILQNVADPVYILDAGQSPQMMTKKVKNVNIFYESILNKC